MDAAGERQRQIDEQLAAGEADGLRITIRDMLKQVHTGLPGKVVSFSATTQTAKVQPCIKRLWIDDGWLALPECVDVPVYFPGGGGYVLTFPVAAGDSCLLVFAERAIDYWWEKGGVQEPSEVRMHDLSDAFAFVGFRPKPGAVSGFAAGRAELRNQAGDVVVAIDGTTAYLGGVAGAERTAKMDTFLASLNTYLAALNTGTAAALTALGLGAAGTTLGNAQTLWQGGPLQATFKTTKAKVL